MDSILITAFIVGLLGGVHCLGMCSGVVGGLTFSLDPRAQANWRKTMFFQLAYNMGRISSYVVIGALFGLFGMALGSVAAFLPVQQALQIVAGLFMVALGLYLGGWWFAVAKVERVGQKIWQRIAPYAQKMKSVRHYHQAWL